MLMTRVFCTIALLACVALIAAPAAQADDVNVNLPGVRVNGTSYGTNVPTTTYSTPIGSVSTTGYPTGYNNYGYYPTGYPNTYVGTPAYGTYSTYGTYPSVGYSRYGYTGGYAYPTSGYAYPTSGYAYQTGYSYPTTGYAYPTTGYAYPTTGYAPSYVGTSYAAYGADSYYCRCQSGLFGHGGFLGTGLFR